MGEINVRYWLLFIFQKALELMQEKKPISLK